MAEFSVKKTRKRTQKMSTAGRIGSRKNTNLAKCGRKEAGKYFFQFEWFETIWQSVHENAEMAKDLWLCFTLHNQKKINAS
jgi:hypothetical protein